MAAYNNIEESLAGLQQGFDYGVQGAGVAKSIIKFGQAVMGYVGDGAGRYAYFNDVAKLVFSADLVSGNNINMTVNGDAMSQVTFASTHEDTMALLVSAIEGLGYEAVLDPADTNDRTLLIRTRGVDAAITSLAVTGGASQASVTTTYDTGQVLLGVAMRTVQPTGQYEIGAPVALIDGGDVSTLTAGTTQPYDLAYLQVSGDQKGYFSPNGNLNSQFVFRSSGAGAGSIVTIQVRNVPIRMGLAAKFI